MENNVLQDIVIICEDSMEGIFTAIYEAYELKKDHRRICIQTKNNQEYHLFASYSESITDRIKAEKVTNTIIREFGMDAFQGICQALATEEKDKADMVYHGIVTGFSMKNRKGFLDNLANPYINKIFTMSRFTGNEAHHLMGFLRFQELENGILFSKIGPKNNILTFLAPHFADRLPNENFMIYDENRKLCVVHPKKMQWILVEGEKIDEEIMNKFSVREEEYQELFRYFCQTIAIKERINLKLQKQMLPLRFQEFMTEFQ